MKPENLKMYESVAALGQQQALASAALQATLYEFLQLINSNFAAMRKDIEDLTVKLADLESDVSFLKSAIHSDGPTHYQNLKVPKSKPFLVDPNANNVENFHLSQNAKQKCHPPFHRQQMGRCSSNVPEEVVEEIFSWLPPESLIRFKCVCKSWYSLITSLFKNLDFVTKHLHNANNNILSPKSFLLCDVYSENEHLDNSSDNNNVNILMLNISSDYGEKDEIHSVIGELQVPSPLEEWYKSEDEDEAMRGHVGGAAFYHCDGIICLVCRYGTMLWNPALRESKIIPKSNFDDVLYIGTAGFGYDPVVNDYKVLRSFPYDELFGIYSLNTNTWRYIMKDIDSDEFRMDDIMQVCYKGICYWFSNDSREKWMVSFDLHAEQHRIIPLPDYQKLHSRRTLKVCNDSIAFVISCGNGSTIPIKMWVMKYCSDGVSDSSFIWIKYLSISIATCFRTPQKLWDPLTFWKRNELLLEEGNELFSYNLSTKKLRKLVYPGVDHITKLVLHGPDCSLFFLGSYVKSLVSVNRRG